MSIFTNVISKVAILLMLVGSAYNVLANEHHHHEEHAPKQENHHHNAHIHGAAELALVIDNNNVLINLTIPADSLVGFEHQATTEYEIATVKKLQSSLTDIHPIISIAKGSCEVTDTHIDVSTLLPSKHEHHSHDHNSHSKLNEPSEHSEVVIDYTLECATLTNASSADLHIFEHYPSIETINAQWVTHNKQGSQKLTHNHKTLSWK